MPRGVYYNQDAAITIHLDSSGWVGEEDEWMEAELWRETVDTIMEAIEKRWPSFYQCDRWNNREDHVLLANRHAEVMVYEDGGMTSISLVPRALEYSELAEHWCGQIAGGLQAMLDKAFKGQTLDRTSGYTMRVREVVTS